MYKSSICPGISPTIDRTDYDGTYLVNKTLRAAGKSANIVCGGEIVRKLNIWPRSEASRANMKF